MIDHVENNTTNFVNNPDQKMQRYASGDEKATRASPSGHFEADASQCHLLRNAMKSAKMSL